MNKGRVGNAGAEALPKTSIPGVIGTTQREAFFLLGQAFTQSADYTIGDGATMDFLLDPTGYTPDEEQLYGQVIFDVPTFFAAAGPLVVSFFAAPDISAPGTPLSPGAFNRDANSSRVSQMLLTHTPTIVSDGVLYSKILIPATAGGPVNVGSQSFDNLPFNLNLANKTLMRVVNENGANTRFGVRNSWFEI